MTAADIDLAMIRYAMAARDFRCCAKRGDARCKPTTTPYGVYQYELVEKFRNVCTTDEV